MKKFIVLIIYDIVDNKIRLKMVKCLERYGVRVQKSAFEALLNRKQYDAMIRQCSRLINPNIYLGNWRKKRTRLCHIIKDS